MTRRQVCLAAAMAPPLAAQSIGERFRGAWSLVSYEQRKAGAPPAYPMGKDALGRLSYDADGRMAAQLMRRERPRFASRSRYEGTLEELRAAFEGFLSYYGPYRIDETKRTVTHHVECCSYPNWVGTEQVRRFEFDGGRLILYAPGDYKLVWTRSAA
jgi:lipocalin-like protein